MSLVDDGVTDVQRSIRPGPDRRAPFMNVQVSIH